MDTDSHRLDLHRRLLDLLSRPKAPQHVGRSLRGSGGQANSRSLYAMRWSETLQPVLARKAVIGARHKLILSQPSGRAELYDRKLDPGERRDLAATAWSLVTRLRRQLERFEEAAPRYSAPRVGIAPDSVLHRQLRMLGYAH